jgi:hypothetical protein
MILPAEAQAPAAPTPKMEEWFVQEFSPQMCRLCGFKTQTYLNYERFSLTTNPTRGIPDGEKQSLPVASFLQLHPSNGH